MSKKALTWEPRRIDLRELKENPDNPKLLNEKGRDRLQKLLSKFGLAGTLIANTDMTIIDGHKRRQQLLSEGITHAFVSFPSRKLTEKEYKELNSLFDLAKAGDPDMMMIEETLGEEIMEEYGLTDDDKVDIKPKEVELKPFKRTHILLSFPPEKMGVIQPHLQKICDHSFVEYEQGNN